MNAMQTDDRRLFERAVSAHYKFRRVGQIVDQPSRALSGIEVHGSHEYLVLRNTRDLLGVYRITNQGVLKRLRRWPKTID
jgi:hypothetical protein